MHVHEEESSTQINQRSTASISNEHQTSNHLIVAYLATTMLLNPAPCGAMITAALENKVSVSTCRREAWYDFDKRSEKQS